MELLIWAFAGCMNAFMTVCMALEHGMPSIEVTSYLACTVACLAMVRISLMEGDE